MSKIIADIGSCSGGKLDRCLDAIKLCKDLGVSVVKFQMFYGEKYTKVGNIELPREHWPAMVEFAQSIDMLITASAFDFSAVNLLNRSPVPFIKFSYAMRFNELLNQCDKPVMVTCDPMCDGKMPKGAIKLCRTDYPDKCESELKFTHLFPRFDGLSDHTLGIDQSIRAHQAGAKWIEKHLKLSPEIGCPDEAFAIDAKQMDQLVRSTQ